MYEEPETPVECAVIASIQWPLSLLYSKWKEEWLHDCSKDIRYLLEIKLKNSMVDPKLPSQPKICYRPIRPCDLETLQHIHAKLFPIR